MLISAADSMTPGQMACIHTVVWFYAVGKTFSIIDANTLKNKGKMSETEHPLIVIITTYTYLFVELLGFLLKNKSQGMSGVISLLV